jgi:hypothetical protein
MTSSYSTPRSSDVNLISPCLTETGASPQELYVIESQNLKSNAEYSSVNEPPITYQAIKFRKEKTEKSREFTLAGLKDLSELEIGGESMPEPWN